VYLSLPDTQRTGPHGTFNSHNVEKDMETAARIDYIYYRGDGVTPLNYCCDTTLYDGLYPSDHCPIYSDIIFKAN
jgi:exonuclease III